MLTRTTGGAHAAARAPAGTPDEGTRARLLTEEPGRSGLVHRRSPLGRLLPRVLASAPRFVPTFLLAFVLAFVPALAGCHTYAPLEDARPRVGQRVRAHLSDSGARALTGYLGNEIESIDGTVLQSGLDSLGLAVHAVVTAQLVVQDWNGEVVQLPNEAVARLEERRLSAARSAVFAGGVLIASILLRTLFDIGGSGDRGDGPAAPPVQQ